MTTAVGRDLSVNLAPLHPGGLVLTNPVIGASGTVAYGNELGQVSDIASIGGVVCKGITRHPRLGNPQPRLAETASGLLNTIGLQNVGAEAAAEKLAPIWAAWPTKVIANISGETVAEFDEIARILDGRPGISALEVNIGCPNVERGGLEFGVDAHAAALVTETVKKASSLPVMVKLTPNVTDITQICRAVVDSGADCISLVNTFVGLSIDVPGRRLALSTVTGGLSGPAIKPLALAMVYKAAGAVDVPVVGMGGIANAQDALEFIMAGAMAVQVGTANFTNPRACVEIAEGIGKYMEREGLDSLSTIVGAARI